MPKRRGGYTYNPPGSKKGRASRYGDGPSEVKIIRPVKPSYQGRLWDEFMGQSRKSKRK